MEDSSSKEVTERTMAYNSHNSPCYFLEQATRAFLGCFGVNSFTSENSSDHSKADTSFKDPPTTEQSTDLPSIIEQRSDPPTPTTEQEADPPALTTEQETDPPAPTTEEGTDPPSTTEEEMETTEEVADPPRPPISSGGGGQIN